MCSGQAQTTRDGETVRLFDGQLLAGDGDAVPGSVLGFEDGALIVAARGGRLRVGRVKIGSGKKVAAAEAGLAAGDRLG